MTTHITGATAMSQASIQNHRVVSRDKWVAERKTLLAHEKELTRFGDQIARERRALPWVRIDKTYKFDTPMGRRTLADLFDGRRQLLVQHLMLAPGWEHACKNCSYMADHTDGAIVHLAQRDVTFVAVSRAPLSEIERFRQAVDFQHPTDQDFDQFCAVMEQLKDVPVHVHCIANYRVSAFFYRYRRDVLGMDEARARADMEEVWHPEGVWAAFVSR
jgi:predicted dithiol-disulfide oxidoreductase (DUF899 family)